MTDKEIKFELAKIALERCNFLTSETLTESLKNLYDWIVEEQDVEVKTEQKSSFDDIDIKKVLNIIHKNQYGGGIATSLERIFNDNNINTVGDLMRIGRHDFSKYRLVGKKSMWAINEVLEELGVTAW